MSKVKFYEVDEKERYQTIGYLLNVISELKTKKEIIDFFMGMLTKSEALMMGRRIQLAKMIIDEENIETIRKKLKVSYQNIAKTENWIKGRGNEYFSWISKCINKGFEDKNIKNKKDIKEFSLLDKYPEYRFLRDLLN